MGRKRGWIHQRTNLEKILLILSCLFLVTVIILGIVQALSSGNSESGNGGTKCWTKDCIVTAGKVLSMLDENTDPCTDFYAYACGKTHVVSPSMEDLAANTVRLQMKNILESSSNDEIRNFDSAKSLYNSCVKFDGLRDDGALRDLVHTLGIGTWPLVDTFFDMDSRLTLEQRISALALLGVDIAFKLEVVPDPHMPRTNLLKVTAGGPREKGRSAGSIRGDVGLRARTFHAFLLLGAEHTHARTDASDILSADAHYAQILYDDENPCDSVDIIAAEESIKELNRLIPEMNWTALVSMIKNEAELGQQSFGIELHCKNKIRDYLNFLDDLPPRISYNYLGWRFFSVFEHHLRPDSVEAGQTRSGRWLDCIQLMEMHFPLLFVPALLPPVNIANKISDIAETELSVLKNLVSHSKWISPNRKESLQNQMSESHFGKTVLQEFANKTFFGKIPQVHEGNYSLVIIQLEKQKFLSQFRKLNKDEIDLLEVKNLFSSEALHASLALEIAKARPPFLDLDGPDWMNYGGFGASNARFLSSRLLSLRSGFTLDDRTTLWDIWFKNASFCFLNQIAKNFESNMEALHHDKWLKAMFLDSSSLQVAYKSAEKMATKGQTLPGLDMLNDPKMIFLSYAQAYCEGSAHNKGINEYSVYIPMNKRVNAAVQNVMSFHQVFDCKAPNHKQECEIWT